VLCTPAGVRYRGEKLAVTIVACVSQSRPFLPLDCQSLARWRFWEELFGALGANASGVGRCRAPRQPYA
jgi:hypothetical protein